MLLARGRAATPPGSVLSQAAFPSCMRLLGPLAAALLLGGSKNCSLDVWELLPSGISVCFSRLTIKMVHAEAFSRPLSRNEVVGLIFRLTIFGAVTYFTIKWMVDAIDPTRKQKVEAQKQAEKLMKQIGVKNVKLSEYEMSIAAHLVDPLNMHVTWSDIAGLDDVITDLKDTVILPIKKKHLFENSRLLQPPKGVLLYGPPGCGKTLIAKATAKEAGCRFINLQPSTLTDKWYGESQKLAAAVFSLAIKLQPSIIFIDEIDSFLRNRSSSDHEATAMMKAQFMSLWDGLDTDHSCQVFESSLL
ncbi:hypothetical protein EI555_013899 [Monodon monoceros]|uniref:Outer mitochondrial transmembrane helix translocase n=1 Tax=Monodon monoceros TaxID=40151 RepID=A0A4U1F923_MONMO|nr:hypothetical protein EI555_013899 [Monodon monoceros]